jgi:histone-lysine N-methyltransferase SETD7
MVRIIGTLPNDPEDVCEENTSPALGFIGHYKNGIPSGYCWKGLLGGSWIYGKVDENGDFSGDDIAYINQDMSTAFKGRFSKGVMIKGKSVKVIGDKCNEEGIKIIEFSDSCSSMNEEYHFESPSSNTFGDQPLVVDPLDNKYVRLGISNVDTNEKSQIIKQNGAFANIDIPPGTVISHNNGYILSKNQRVTLKRNEKHFLENKQNFYNVLEKEDKNTCENTSENDWKYSTKMKCGMTLDIPFKVGQDPSKYRSTRGHKINHCFSNMNAFLTHYDSARFGIISVIMSRYGITIPKGEELFVHYGYPYSRGPAWYKELYKDFLFGKKPSKGFRQNKVKDCYLGDGTKMDVDHCVNYLNEIKNKILSSTNITSATDASNERLDSILKLHKKFAVQSIHSLSAIDDYLMSIDKL